MGNAGLVLGIKGLLTALMEESERLHLLLVRAALQTLPAPSVQSRQRGAWCGQQCGTKPALVASPKCRIHSLGELSQQGMSMAGVCRVVQRVRMVFVVFIFSLLVGSGAPAGLCVSVPNLHPTALLSTWGQVCGAHVRQPLSGSQPVKGQPCPKKALPAPKFCPWRGGEEFSSPWPCLQPGDGAAC